LTVSATSSSTYFAPTTTGLTVLAEASATATQLATEREISIIGSQIRRRLATTITALQAPADPAVTNALQTGIANLQKRQAAISALSTQYGANGNVLSDLSTQLAALQTAAANGDSAGFDAGLAAANSDVGDLVAVTAPAPFQPDRISTLRSNGLAIASSATYDLSTPAGQAAAAQDVKNAQDLIGQIFAVISSNQLLAGSLTSSLATQSQTLSRQLNNLQNAASTANATKIARLTQQAQDQVHLIELALGNTQTLATMLKTATNLQQPVTSVFGALANSASGTASSATAPAILSVFA
jgi:hypothetical protein